MHKSYTIAQLKDIQDILGDYPGDMKPLKDPLTTTQVALTYRRMPAKTGAKGSYGHRHHTQEEIIFVFTGKVQVKVDNDVVELGPKSAIRIAPGAIQGTWNEGPADAEILIISNRMEPEDQVDKIDGFWPA
ncbi:MAG TPA: cupin domain-containing protein [Patescibacteria group bacterium]|nr:cupin domain-containing protein [Patescibacteria group bacterium]